MKQLKSAAHRAIMKSPIQRGVRVRTRQHAGCRAGMSEYTDPQTGKQECLYYDEYMCRSGHPLFCA